MALGTRYSLKVTIVAAVAGMVGIVAAVMGFSAERKRITVSLLPVLIPLSLKLFLDELMRCINVPNLQREPLGQLIHYWKLIPGFFMSSRKLRKFYHSANASCLVYRSFLKFIFVLIQMCSSLLLIIFHFVLFQINLLYMKPWCSCRGPYLLEHLSLKTWVLVSLLRDTWTVDQYYVS